MVGKILNPYLDDVLTSTFISEELLLTPSEPLFNWSLEMTTMSEPFLPPEPVQPLVPLVLDLRMRITNKMITIVTISPPMTPDKTMTNPTVAEKERKIFGE